MADRIDQEVIEVLLDNPAVPRIDQLVVEIILCPNPPAIVCPIATTATVGVPYTGMLLATDGLPPYTYEIIA